MFKYHWRRTDPRAFLTRLFLVSMVLVVVNHSALVSGQIPDFGKDFGNFPRDPGKMMDQMFGNMEYTEEELARIEKVPVSVREESEYGKRSVANFRRELKRQRISVSNRSDAARYVRQLVKRLHPLMQNARRYDELDVWIVDSDEIMAWAYPGGTIFVYQGMLDFAPSEAALVGVLGHELSHIDRGHQLFDLKRARLMQENFQNPAQFSFERMMQNQQFMMKSFARPFRPEEETMADRDGTMWAARLGYDPRELAHLFQRMADRQQRQDRRDPARAAANQWMPTFLRSHPATAARFDETRELAEQIIRQHGDRWYVGRRNLKERLSWKQREFPDEWTR